MKFQKAQKKKQKARVAFYAPSGGGKTMGALRVATGLGGRIAVIDSEHGSASKYADRFDFDALDLESKSVDSYIAAIKMAAAEGYDVLVIDSLSHAWQELLEEIDRLAKSKHRGNTWSAWRDGTPKQRDLVESILSYPGHVIATMRAKTEWDSEKGDNGKVQPRKVGLAPEQGKGIEYEFDVLVAISTEHVAHIEKDRSGRFQDRTIEKIGEDFGRELAAWLDQGIEAPAPKPAPSTDDRRAKALEWARAHCAAVAALTDAEAIRARRDRDAPALERLQGVDPTIAMGVRCHDDVAEAAAAGIEYQASDEETAALQALRL